MRKLETRKAALDSACFAPKALESSLPGFERSGRRCRSRVRCRRRSPQGSAAAPEGYDQVAVPRTPPAGAKTSRNGSRRWKSSLRGFVRPRCCRSTAAIASSRQALGTQARPAARRARTGQRPGLDERTLSTTRRRMRASAAGAGSPMRRTAPRNPPSSRSRSRPTSA